MCLLCLLRTLPVGNRPPRLIPRGVRSWGSRSRGANARISGALLPKNLSAERSKTRMGRCIFIGIVSRSGGGSPPQTQTQGGRLPPSTQPPPPPPKPPPPPPP